MIADLWPLVKITAQRHHVVKDIICLLKQSGWIAMLVAGFIGGQRIFCHVTW
jgi:hypothetical protein